MELLNLNINGIELTNNPTKDFYKSSGWTSVDLSMNLNELAKIFAVSIHDPIYELIPQITAGSPVNIQLIDGLKGTSYEVFNGFVYEIDESESSDTITASIGGRSISSDLVDCTAIIEGSGVFKEIELIKFLSLILKPFNIGVISHLASTPVLKNPKFDSGETALEVIDKFCRIAGVLPVEGGDGVIYLEDSQTTDRAEESLIVGQNVVSLGKSTDYSERYSEYTVIRQNSRAGEKWKKTDLQQTGIALDLDLTRYRPLIIEAEHKKERGLSLLKKQAAWEAQVRAGRSVVYNYIVDSWFQKDKQGNIIKPWYINQIVNVKDSRRNMDEDLLISELSYMRNESSGPQTRLVLQSQSAFVPPPSNQVSLSL